jgi:neurofibromin 1
VSPPVRSRPNELYRCGALQPILDEILLHGQNAATLGAAQALLRTLTVDNQLSEAMGVMHPLTDILDDMGFSGLWRSCSLGSMEDFSRECFDSTEKLIEV